MSSGILTRWPVSEEIVVSAVDLDPGGLPTDDAFGGWFARAWDDYLQRCPRLRVELARGATRLSMGPLRLSPRRRIRPLESVQVAIATTEIWPAGFEMALRVRVLGDDAGRVVDGRRLVGLVAVANDEQVTIPDEIRRELIAVQLAASEYC